MKTIHRRHAIVLALAALPACGDGKPDAGVPDAAVPDLSVSVARPAWEGGLAATSALYPARRGLRDVRGIIHFHSVNSHDACDGNPRPGGTRAMPCYQDLRDALCRTRQDYAMLTDHDDNMADQEWDELFTPLPGDEPVMVGGKHVASWLACPGGHKVLLQVGGENEAMPLGLEGHVSEDREERHRLMDGSGADSIAAFRANGAVVAFAHTEEKSLELLEATQPDAVEIYNMHANLDPRIRLAMGLKPTTPIERVGPFLSPREGAAEPDLIFLGVGEELPAELSKFRTMLSRGARLTGTAGSDAHQNVFSTKMQDGERGDSYRRVLRWFSNHLLVDEVTPAKVKEAIKRGRLYVLFEILGPAKGFDYRAEDEAQRTYELGDEVALADAPTLVVDPPRADVPEGVEAPILEVRVVRADGPDGTVVAMGDGAATLRYTPDKVGAYYVEVRALPRHLRPWMGIDEKNLLRQLPWIYANPIYVK